MPDNYFKNENDARAAVTAIYSPMRGQGGIYDCYVETYLMLSNLAADDMGLRRSDLEVVEKFIWNSTTNAVTKHYSDWIKHVSRATLLMDDLQRTPMNDKRKQEFVAEVQCARGQYMFFLYDFYGTAGVVMDPAILRDPGNEVILERMPKNDFVNLIEKDLKESAAVLPERYAGPDFGRFTKGTAYAILAKLYLQEKRWNDAEQVCREILKLGYELQPSYASVFAVENEKNKEVIWAVSCLSEGGDGNTWMTHVVPPNYPLKNTLIQRWNVHSTPWRFYDKYEKGDNRLKSLIGEFKYLPAGATDSVLATRYNYEHLKNGAIPIKYPEDPKQTSEKAGNDKVIYRYSDVLLELAEAINEQNGPTPEAIGYVEQIRKRVGLPNSIPASATAGKDAFSDFILDERGRELFCEGHRRRDLIRHNKFISTAHQEGYISAQSYMVLFPLPQNILDESKGKIKQNPGY
ncbi:RagB/SusD family nutrient uptake outer membrane protein [Pedobacter steynii]|nr:RagB/SusD family nutrient uptake outer membrane protein [Pedobacter steynii]NQX42295.1 RagB/SusD family nutrient uptake outer membrane protein [Pedobacter steynii]